MKKILFLVLTFLLSLSSYSQIEGFEGTTLPDTGTDQWSLSSGVWGVFDNGVGLTQSWNISTTAHTGVRAAFMNRENIGMGNTSQDFLATPQVTVPANGQLRFWSRTNITGNQGTLFKIMVSTNAVQNNVASYVEVESYTEDELSTVFNEWDERIVDLTAYAGQAVYVAFMMQFTQPTAGVGGDRWLLDDVKIVERCLEPTALSATPLSTSAILNWAGPAIATSYLVAVVPFGSTDPLDVNAITVTGATTTTVSGTTNP
ncbi:MAG TPA: choice-of-anchor J domain-containing protein, partial [Flavobacterium sp.]